MHLLVRSLLYSAHPIRSPELGRVSSVIAGTHRADPPLIILGAGPVGLVAAIRARQLGIRVELRTNRLPSPEDLCRLEVVPAQLIALLVEFGVHPSAIGVERIHERRLTQWHSRDVIASMAPPSAHVLRPALDLALLDLAERCGVSIRLVSNSTVDAGTPVLDATGRSAATAIRIARPEVPLVSRTFVQPADNATTLEGFAIAAGPEGYAYRLCNALKVTLGVVGHGNLLRGSARSVLANIRTFAPWIIDGLDPYRLEAGSAGAASLQWCVTAGEGVQPIGDTRIARDALASQGLAIGLADALRAVSAMAAHIAVDGSSSQVELAQHRRKVGDLIAKSPFAAAPEWRRYLAFLRE